MLNINRIDVKSLKMYKIKKKKKMPKIKSFKIFSIGKSIVIYVGIKLSYPLCIAAVWCMYESVQIPLPKIEFNAIFGLHLIFAVNTQAKFFEF